MNVRVEKRFSGGFTLLGVYTWSKAMGIFARDGLCCFTVMDGYNLRMNYGPSNDYRHNAVISYVYDLPFGGGKRFLGGADGLMNLLIGGWQVNGITTFRSGAALSVSSPVSNNRGNRAGNRPDRIANGNLPSGQRTVERWFDTTAFRDLSLALTATRDRGILRGPGLANWDVSLFKNVRVKEHVTAQFRWEMFNAFNHVNYQNPSINTGDPRFGRISGALAARQMQLGVKALF